MDDGHVQVIDTFSIWVNGFPARDSFSFKEGDCGELLVWSDLNDWVYSVKYHFYRYGYLSYTLTMAQKRNDLNFSNLRSGTYVLETFVWNSIPLTNKYIDTIILVGGHDLSTKKTLLTEPNQYHIKITNFSINPGVVYSWAIENSLGLTIMPDTLPEFTIQVWEYTKVRAVVSSDKPCIDTLWFGLEVEPNHVKEIEKRANIFPNPCKNYFNVESHKPILSLSLFDIQGKPVLQKEDSESPNTQMEVAGLPKGTYVLAIRYADYSLGYHVVAIR